MRFDNAGWSSLRVEEPLSTWTADYMAYIHSPEWAKKRREAFAHHGRVCAKCRATKLLHVHHLTYKRLFKEDVKTDLQILCKACHMAHHAIKIVVKPPKHKKQLHPRLTDVPLDKWVKVKNGWHKPVELTRGGVRFMCGGITSRRKVKLTIGEPPTYDRVCRECERLVLVGEQQARAQQSAEELRAAAELLWEEEDIPTLTELDREFLAIIRGF